MLMQRIAKLIVFMHWHDGPIHLNSLPAHTPTRRETCWGLRKSEDPAYDKVPGLLLVDRVDATGLGLYRGEMGIMEKKMETTI